MRHKAVLEEVGASAFWLHLCRRTKVEKVKKIHTLYSPHTHPIPLLPPRHSAGRIERKSNHRCHVHEQKICKHTRCAHEDMCKGNRRILCRKTQNIHCAHLCIRYCVSKKRLERNVEDSLRRNEVLRRDREVHPETKGSPCGWYGVWSESDRHPHPLPQNSGDNGAWRI